MSCITDDEELISVLEQVRQGDVQSYTHVIRRYQKRIYLYCYYLLQSREEAEDAAQDIFIKALENIQRYSYYSSFSAWLYRIARNHCTDLIKQKKKSFQFLNQYKKVNEDRHNPGYTEIIHDLLDNLNAEEKQILLLRSLEDYNYDEIASIMDLKPVTVRKRYERIRKKLIQYKKKEGAKLYEQQTLGG
ncbi:RNA polymerase sigma factor [Paenibacillus sp. JX-17]|uniref:RNA polymerase sigma factor n=1 Tax=Paenibacillus lacisoli TaxID=3064525 RepID=A0ABT9CGA7_9BACL|nr:RNA polymerase sigma factor [Paenibacillus sp. JX-17]MDO7907674.1 RNA polymerase sigma factor [Paenibacillus sp. JX-17]